MESPNFSSEPDRLKFRRQFLVGPRSFQPDSFWKQVQLKHGLWLSHHVDLAAYEVSQRSIKVTLLGICLDAVKEVYDPITLLENLIQESVGALDKIPDTTFRFSGRWALIAQNENDTLILNDAFGARSIFYSSNFEWIGSTTKIIAANTSLKKDGDVELDEFVQSAKFRKKGGAWLGDTTTFKDCRRLLPNHSLSLSNKRVVRFYGGPSTSDKLDYNSVVSEGARILQNSLAALEKSYPLLISLTAGWDSRLILAMTRGLKPSFFVDRYNQLDLKHKDIVIAKKLAEKYQLDLEIRNPDTYEFPRWFEDILKWNDELFHWNPNRWIIYDHMLNGEDRLVINGNGGEIVRSHFQRYLRKKRPEAFDPLDLVKVFGYGSIPASQRDSLGSWLESFRKVGNNRFLLDMFYWEQKIGIWGSSYRSHQDAAVEEISPFNCRYLIDLMLKTPEHKRLAPKYVLFRDLIEFGWKELLEVAVNPKRQKPWYKKFEKKLRLRFKKLIGQRV